MEEQTIATLAEMLDEDDMLGHLKGFVNDLYSAFERLGSAGPDWVSGIRERRWNGVLCLGMGGSAAGGSALSSLADSEGALPVWVHRDQNLPSWWNPSHLVIATSYSGNTEETLKATREVIEQGGTVIAICSGGELAGLAELVKGVHLVLVPGGQPPRSAFGHLFGTQLSLAWNLGLLPRPSTLELKDMLESLQSHLDECDFTANPENEIAHLAASLVDRPIAVVGCTELSAMVHRFTCQLNENSARFARGSVLPEMNHNELIAWGGVGEDIDPRSSEQALLQLMWRGMEKRTLQRFDWFSNHLETEHAWRLICEGRTLLEAILHSCIIMDWLSCALALLHGKDPSSITPIQSLKDHLASVE